MTAQKKVALVTGAGTGVGRAVTLALMREGYAVVLAGRRKDMLEAVAKEGAQTPGAAMCVSTDVAEQAQCVALVEAAVSGLEGVEASRLELDRAGRSGPHRPAAILDPWPCRPPTSNPQP